MRRMPALSDQLRTFLENLELSKGRSALTVRNYEFYLRRFIDWADDPDPKNITQDTIHRYRLYLNRLEDPHRGPLKKNTQNYHLIALRSFLKYLARNDIKTLAPEKIELAKQGTREVSFLNQEDLERLMHAPDIADTAPLVKLRDRAILRMLFSTGLRVSELAGLKRDQVSLERDELTVRGKGDKLRIVFVSDMARSSLREYLDARQDSCPFLFIRHDRGRGRKNPEDVGALTPRSMERLVHYYATVAGITKRISPHTLRHSFATDLLQNGADIRSVQSLLGHSSITTTQIYTHITNQQLKEVFNAFHGKQMDEEDEQKEKNKKSDDEEVKKESDTEKNEDHS
jgi:site-specific recombinase XerD